MAREPLVHFLLIGIGLFWLFDVVNDNATRAEPGTIIVDEARNEQLSAGFQAVWRRPPTAVELHGLIEDYVREEVFVREALALGLDRDDIVIRRRLRQKMEFLARSAAEALAPSEAELMAHHAAHPGRFSRPARLAFSQVYLGGIPGAAEIAEARAALAAGVDPHFAGAASPLPVRSPLAPREMIDGAFGAGFFDALASLPSGSWVGPVGSGYGQHLVWIDASEPEALSPFEDVRDRVLLDFKAQRADDLAEQQYERLRARYAISIRDAAGVEAAE